MTETNEPLNLNIGGGTGPELPGYRVVDRKTGDEAYPLTLGGEQVAEGSVDLVRASHVLEHVSHRLTLDVLRDWVRALKPGGKLRVAVPDFDWICRQHLAGARGVEGYLMGGHVDADDHHGAVFTENKLRVLMRAAGLRRVRRWESDAKDCSSLPVSLNLEGTKPEPVEVKGVRAVMSVPRYGLTTTFGCVIETCSSLGIQLSMGRGVFWCQALTSAIEQIIACGAKYVLSIDFDTTFSPEDVEELYRLAEANPDADAICALQQRRGMPGQLCTFGEPGGPALSEIPAEWFGRDLVKCRTAHFGLTLLRCDAFAKMPRPWFAAVPDADGRWGDGRIDSDVKFWLQWGECGNSLHLAPLVVAGHVEEVVMFPDRQLRPAVLEVSEWRRDGVPVEALR